MTVANELYALVPADEVERAIGALQVNGVAPSEIEVHDVEPGRYALHDERLHEEAIGARQGALIGAGIGVIVGLVGAAVTFGLDTPVAWAVLAFGGGAFGALIGGMTGLQKHDHFDDDPREWLEVEEVADKRLLAVHCLHFRNKAHHVLERFPDVHFVDAPHPN